MLLGFVALVYAIIGSAPSALAAPCCASSSQAAALLTGDEAMKLQASVGQSNVVADAPERGLPTFRQDSAGSENSRTFRLSGAHAIGDRFQAGAALSFQDHSRKLGSTEHSSSGFGDTVLTGGYEILPEWEYSSWRPRGFTHLSLSLPTGRSIHDSRASSATDVTGRGFFAVSPGATFVKRFQAWDATASPEMSFLFPKEFSRVGRVSAGPEARIYLGVGRSFGEFRAGMFLSPEYRSSQSTESEGATSKSTPSLRWDTGAEITALFEGEWAASLVYNDQTLVGPARNTTLSRGASVVLVKRFLR